MKAKKALKRLNKVESLLSNVIGQFPLSKDGLGDLLNSAKAAIVRAKKKVSSLDATGAAKKPPAKARKHKQWRLTADGRKGISRFAKKRGAVAKRKGVHAVTGRR
jgi:hypothetical protein